MKGFTSGGPMANMEAGNCKVEQELSVAEKLNEMAKETALFSEAVASRLEHKLEPLCWPVDPSPEKLATSSEDWPDYFASLREQMQRIHRANLRIENALDRTGI